jgi:hypothetical protein
MAHGGHSLARLRAVPGLSHLSAGASSLWADDMGEGWGPGTKVLPQQELVSGGLIPKRPSEATWVLRNDSWW